jgi:maltoporin
MGQGRGGFKGEEEGWTALYVQERFEFGNEKKAFVDHKLVRGRVKWKDFEVINGSCMASIVKV